MDYPKPFSSFLIKISEGLCTMSTISFIDAQVVVFQGNMTKADEELLRRPLYGKWPFDRVSAFHR